MNPAHVLEIKTPKGVFLNGLWWGPKSANKVIIFIHGLTGSAFSMRATVQALTAKDIAVITLNTRGFGEINSVRAKKGGKTSYVPAGTAHEVFTDCVDDIDGAIRFAKKQGAKNIYLAGHSTGCQKIVYWASKRNDPRLRGLVLFGPLSDYSGALAAKGEAALSRGVAYARKLIAAGKPHELMPARLGEWFACDAQRYVSLYSPESPEEIFSYARPERRPVTLEKVRKPILAILAGRDEYGDRRPGEICKWFLDHIYEGEVVIIPRVMHGFKGGEKNVASVVKNFMKETVR